MKTSLHFEAPSDLSVGTVRITGEGKTVADWVATPDNRTFSQDDLMPGIYSAEIGPQGFPRNPWSSRCRRGRPTTSCCHLSPRSLPPVANTTSSITRACAPSRRRHNRSRSSFSPKRNSSLSPAANISRSSFWISPKNSRSRARCLQRADVSPSACPRKAMAATPSTRSVSNQYGGVSRPNRNRASDISRS